MEDYVLSPRLRKTVGFFFASTFVSIAGYLVFFLFFVFAVIGGWLEQEDQLLEFGSYAAGSFILVSVLVMACYAIGYVYHLWNKGLRREALKGLITLIFLNVLTGYIWFYWSELKRQEIRFKLI